MTEKEEPQNEFLQSMVQKCEVSNYQEMYIKLVKNKGNIVQCEKLFSKDAKYTLKKIQNDILPYPEILLLHLFNRDRTINDKITEKGVFEKKPYLINQEGLLGVLRYYRDAKYLGKEIAWKDLLDLWQVREEEAYKLRTYFENLIKEKRMHATLIRNEEKEEEIMAFKFLSLMEMPRKRKKIWQLTGIIVIFMSILALLLYLTRNVDYFNP